MGAARNTPNSSAPQLHSAPLSGTDSGKLLLHVSAIWSNWNWSTSAWSYRRALNSEAGLTPVCATILISKLPLKQTEVSIPCGSKATLLRCSQTPFPKQRLASLALASPGKQRLLDTERRCYHLLTTQTGHLLFSKINKQTNKNPTTILSPPHTQKRSLELIRNTANFTPWANKRICSTYRTQIWSLKDHCAIRESLTFIYFTMQPQSNNRTRKHQDCVENKVVYNQHIKHYKSH